MCNQPSQTHQQTLTEPCDVLLNQKTVEFDLGMVATTRNPENVQKDRGRRQSVVDMIITDMPDYKRMTGEGFITMYAIFITFSAM